MKIGLISDTHVPRDCKEMPREVAQAFVGVELILHAGDIYTSSVLDWLEKIAPTLACQGNGDWGMPPDRRVKESQVITLQGVKIGLTHAVPLPLDPPLLTLERVMKRNFGGPVDVIVCGDTHVEYHETLDGVTLINPGSPTVPHGLLHRLGTVAILELVDGKIGTRFIELNQFRSRD